MSNKENLCLIDADHIMVVCPDKKERDEAQNVIYDEFGQAKYLKNI
jgi:hypothetical protein